MKTNHLPPAFRKPEEIRERLRLSHEAFSIKLGFSAAAYRIALRRGAMSRWMAKEISQRFGVPLEELR